LSPIRIALIGCGNIAKKHLTAIYELGPAVELVALCDMEPDRITSLLEVHASLLSIIPKIYTDADSCIQQGNVDLIVITTSTDSHVSLALAAIHAGKHVLVEKPLALTVQDARYIVKEAGLHKRVVAVAMQTRYLSQIQAMKRAVDEGRFGRLMHGTVSVRWNRNMEYYKTSPWRASWVKGGGALMNQCIHYIDLLQWLMGPVVSVYGEVCTALESIEAENIGLAILKFANGSIGQIECSTSIYPRNLLTSLSLFGERGTVSLEGEKLNIFKHWLFEETRAEDEDIVNNPEDISHTPLYQDLVYAIRTGSTPLVSVETTLNSLEIVLAIYKSVAEGKQVQLPFDDFDTNQMITKLRPGGEIE